MDDYQLLRFSRQIMLPEIDVDGQDKLFRARVGVIGLGGLGCPAAQYLVASGIGQLTLVDDDIVDLSNLQRQILHEEASIDLPKVDSAAQRLRQLHSGTKIQTLNRRLSLSALKTLASESEVLLDATDNFASRYLINEACLATGTPWVSGAAIRMIGHVVVFDPRVPSSPCYRCLYPEGASESLNCAENGVIAPLVGVIGCMQAMEAIKILCGLAQESSGWLLYFDALQMNWKKLKLTKNPECPDCQQ